MLLDKIKIATFNLLNYIEPPLACYDFDRIYSQEQWNKKQTWIQDYLSKHQPDVIGFQEVFSPASLQQLMKEQGYAYFAVVDSPELIDDYIYRSPVVAIASRYPITGVTAISADTELAIAMGLQNDYSFSRKPLRATIELPHLGVTDCYVVHLKSKRPMLEQDVTETDISSTKSIVDAMTTQICGSWGSSIQRGSEATLLLKEIIERRHNTGNPMMLMGDLNDTLTSGVLELLLTDSLRFNSDEQTQSKVMQYCLKDSWELYKTIADNLPDSPRPATHYYGNKGSVLDYILLSCEFNACYPRSLFEVSDYHTHDSHLINPIFAKDSESTDHAVISITLNLRS